MKMPLLRMFTLLLLPAFGAVAAETAGDGAMDGVASSPKDIKPLKVGESLPSVKVTNIKGKERDLAKITADKPTVVVFYRGGWCPYCNKHLAELGQSEGELKALGYQIIAISPDGTENAGKTAENEDIGYKIFSDNSFAAAKAFGVAFKLDDETRTKYQGYFKDKKDHDFSMLPVPAVFIAGKDGIIKFAYANEDYKIRLSKEDLMKAAKDAV